MVEWRWSLDPLSVRDATANNLAHVLDFDSPRLSAPRYAVPPGPFGSVCGTPAVASAVTPVDTESTEWAAVRALAINYGFPIY
jgi:phospholipase C